MKIPDDGVFDMVKSGISVGAALFSSAAAHWSQAETTWIGKSQGVIQTSDRRILADAAVLNETALGAAVVQDKAITKDRLASHGISTPAGGIAESPDHAVSIAKDLSKSVVVKPARGAMGKGVSVDLRSDEEVRRAYDLALKQRHGPVMVEEYIDIEYEYRCIASAESCVAVVHRILPTVKGDGRSTVRQLVNAKNHLRRQNAAMYAFPIPIDSRTVNTLKRQNVTLSTILDKDRVITVRNVGGLSGGAEPHEVLDKVPDEIPSLARRSIAAIPGLLWGGADIVTERGTGKPYVIEINVCAGYGAATYPVEGEPRDVASYAWHQRLSMSPPDKDLQSSEVSPGLSNSDRKLSEVYPSVNFGSKGVRLSRLFPAWVRTEGYELQKYGVVNLIKSESGTHWVSTALATTQDLLAPRRMLRRQAFVMKLLSLSGVPHSKVEIVDWPDDLQDILRAQESPSMVMPAKAAWDTREARVFGGTLKRTFLNKLFTDSRKWLVQPYPNTPRFRVLATRNRGLAIVLPAGQKTNSDLTEETLSSISLAAVQAVRAIPELRWGMVDLRVEEAAQHADGITIEGLTCQPTLQAEDRILAGDFDQLFREVLESATD